MDKKTTVSIILPTYNGGKYINKAIESVLSQSFSDWELIIIDDGSIDNTVNVVKEYLIKDSRIKYLKNEVNLGIQKSLNKGLREAKGEYIARIDDDDEWIDKNKLKTQIDFLNTKKDYILVGTGTVVVDESGKEIFRYLLPETDQEIRNKLLMKNCFVHSSVLFRKDIVLHIGGYTEKEQLRQKYDYDLCEDYDLWLRLGIIGKLHNLPLYSTRYTSRGNSICTNNKLEQLKKDLILTKEFKNKYPNYFQSLVFGYLRLYSFVLFNFVSPSIKNKIFKLYKDI